MELGAPPSLHGKIHLKFPCWLLEHLPILLSVWCVSKWARHALLWCCYKSLCRHHHHHHHHYKPLCRAGSQGQRNIINFPITHCCLHHFLHYKCINKIQSFIYIICLCHHVVIYEGSLSCDYQLLRKRGSGDVFQLLLMDPRNFPRWQKRSGWWGKGMKRQIVVNEDEWLRDWVAKDFDTKAPLLLFRSWAALSFKVSLSVFF